MAAQMEEAKEKEKEGMVGMMLVYCSISKTNWAWYRGAWGGKESESLAGASTRVSSEMLNSTQLVSRGSTRGTLGYSCALDLQRPSPSSKLTYKFLFCT